MHPLSLLVVGPNPALQRVLSLPTQLELGSVNRAASLSEYVGGKGQGAALALARWAPGETTLASFLGGDTGRAVEALLSASDLELLTQPTAAPTRICTTLLSPGVAGGTEVIDPSGTVSEMELDALLGQIEERLHTFDALAFCGTCPSGAQDIYSRLVSMLAASASGDKCTVLLDGIKQVDEVLNSGRVDVLKINVLEATTLTGTSSAAAAAAVLFAENGALRRRRALLALTDGPKPALLFTSATQGWRLHVPSVEVVNAIGAGDVCTAVFLYHLAKARAQQSGDGGDGGDGDGGGDGDVGFASREADAFAWGLAAACARCAHEQPHFERAEAEAMRRRIRIEAL